MPITINCTMKADVVGGSSTATTHQITPEAYDLLAVDVAAGGSETVEVQPGAAGQVQLLLVTANYYGTDLTYEVDGSGTSIALDAPLLLVGTGAAGLLGALNQIAFTGPPSQDVALQVIVGRNAT